jgi:predicted phosphodiesterase
MKLVFISDIHANYEALYPLRDELRGADRIVCLGDMVGYYCQVNQVIDFLRDLGALCVLGNHDCYLLYGCPEYVNPAVRFGIDVAEETITPANRSWLGSLPLVWGGCLGGRSMLFVHGSPWDPISHYLYADSPRLEELNAFAFDLIACGQTHRLLLDEGQRPHRINPGSVGQPRDVATQASLITLDTATMTYREVRRSFDPEPVIALARTHGAGDWIWKQRARDGR